MKILVADDDSVSRLALHSLVRGWGHEVVLASDGAEAWSMAQGADPPQMAILDWMMPEADGVEICRRFRKALPPLRVYVILLTARGSSEDIVRGLDAGADDFITKPFQREELRARVQAGVRIVELQASLAGRVAELEEALTRVKQLRGLLPICSYCKKIRNDQKYWQQVESYLSEHSEAEFSHGICPECYERFVAPELKKLEALGKVRP